MGSQRVRCDLAAKQQQQQEWYLESSCFLLLSHPLKTASWAPPLGVNQVYL